MMAASTGGRPGLPDPESGGCCGLLFESIPDPPGFRGSYNRLYIGPTGTLWRGTSNALVRGVGPAATVIPLNRNPDEPLSVRAIEETSAGEIWIGTRRGLLRLRNGMVQAHYLLGSNESGDLVNALAMDRNGRLWIAHQHLGVIVLVPDTSSRPDPVPRQLPFRRNGGAPVRLPALPGEAIAYSTPTG